MNRVLSFLFFVLGTVFLNARYDPNFELRLNCGTSITTTYNGNTFHPDQYFDGGGTYTRNPGGLVQPYTTERYDDDKELNYSVPLANGDIRTHKVRVDQENWPDYVSQDDYTLLTLDQIQKHMEEKDICPICLCRRGTGQWHGTGRDGSSFVTKNRRTHTTYHNTSKRKKHLKK